jgi:amino acid transporter
MTAFISAKVGAFATFQYFVSLVTIFGILNWISILVSHIYFVRARQVQAVPDTALAFVSPFGRNGSICALVFACIITVFNGWADFVHDPTTGKFDWKHFIVNYIGIPIFLCMIIGYKVIMQTKGVRPEDADLFSGKAKIDEEEAEFLAEERRRRGGMEETKYEKVYRLTLGNFF